MNDGTKSLCRTIKEHKEKAPLISAFGVRWPPKNTAAPVNRNKFVSADEKTNASYLWSTWFMDAYLFINLVCRVSWSVPSYREHITRTLRNRRTHVSSYLSGYTQGKVSLRAVGIVGIYECATFVHLARQIHFPQAIHFSGGALNRLESLQRFRSMQ